MLTTRKTESSTFQKSVKNSGINQYEVKYGMHYLKGNSQPYFSITINIYEGRTDVGGGADHETIAKFFPELVDLIPWHLVGQDALPMHYLANASYWWKGWKGFSKTHLGDYKDWTPERRQQEEYRILCNHILLEPEEESALQAIENVEQLNKFLNSRIPRLQERFQEVMTRFNVEPIYFED